jgi:hypothetical protein
LTRNIDSRHALPQRLAKVPTHGTPQADVFITFEQALFAEGLDGAGAYMTPAKLAEMGARMERLGV